MDKFGRAGSEQDRALMGSSAEWYLIDRLVEDAGVIDRDLGSKERTELAWKNLRDNCESEAVIQEIFKIANS